MEEVFDDLYMEEREFQDVEGVMEALKAAWLCNPNWSLSELLDNATSAPFCELSSSELIEELNQFIHQNN